ncbi:MAG: NAD-dependent epimerase/dehydratase family protein [Candidatus Omnitrophica bacterium]|nr:NAD-dependent epimerase/dehydratase family protein [Candidatus Omnitrophota bacterium]
MNILITGGAGMVGSHCAEYFARQQKGTVIVYDNLMRSRIFRSEKKTVEYNWEYLKQYPNVVLLRKDIRHINDLQECFKKYKPSIVIHTAGQPGVKFSLNDPQEDFSINAWGTLNVLECMKNYSPEGVLIYCSTNKVYGDNVNRFEIVEKEQRYDFTSIAGIDENLSVDQTGHTPYGVSKLAGDLYVQDFAHTYGIKTAVFRMSCIYGTRQFGFEDQGWLAWFAIRFLQKKPITIYGSGKQVRDVLWVGDLVEAYQKFIDSDLKFGVFNVGGGKENTLSLLELISILEQITGHKVDLKFEDWRRFDQKIYVSDIKKISSTLGWSPRVNPKDGAAKIVEWIKQNKQLIDVV